MDGNATSMAINTVKFIRIENKLINKIPQDFKSLQWRRNSYIYNFFFWGGGNFHKMFNIKHFWATLLFGGEVGLIAPPPYTLYTRTRLRLIYTIKVSVTTVGILHR